MIRLKNCICENPCEKADEFDSATKSQDIARKAFHDESKASATLLSSFVTPQIYVSGRTMEALDEAKAVEFAARRQVENCKNLGKS